LAGDDGEEITRVRQQIREELGRQTWRLVQRMARWRDSSQWMGKVHQVSICLLNQWKSSSGCFMSVSSSSILGFGSLFFVFFFFGSQGFMEWFTNQ
jgi:hypothetical protein